MISYLAGVAAFVAIYLAFQAGTNSYARDAWLWGLCGIVLAATALVLLWKSGVGRSRAR